MELTTQTDEQDNRPSDLEADLNGWLSKMEEVSSAAALEGFTTVIVITGYDPIADRSLMGYGYSGDTYAALGAVQTAADLIKGT